MKLPTAHIGYGAVLVAGALTLALTGCSGGSAGGGDQGPTLPDGVSGSTSLTTPKALSQDLHFAIGSDDAFVNPVAAGNGAHGVVVAIRNSGDEDIKIGRKVNVGPKNQWGSFDEVAGDILPVGDKMPKGCADQLNVNGVTLGSGTGDSRVIKAGETLVGCGTLTAKAYSGGKTLDVAISGPGGSKTYSQTVTVSNSFAE